MGGQSTDRREVLRALSLAAAASQFSGFDRWAFASAKPHAGHAGSAPAKSSTTRYQPQFFSAEEYASLERLTEMIIPSDGTPGAKEAGVSEFIDFMVASDPEIQYRFRYGLGWLDTHARWLFGAGFRDLSEKQQNEMLEHLAYAQRYRPREEDGRAFFRLLREYAVMGYYTSRIGLEQLDYPGLQLVYDEMPGCPHQGDPEHKHLPPPKYKSLAVRNDA
ncbi:MAG: gluconate 2-dehydrogenase subunit 3 family protein [Acidobacteria bacterium]|nr:gluconate 2-dehydrogenase subunit 3 family protein [Acidobacteriota bacterium]MCI0724694.1 gluconate 2-dehydrogenase subunit 3 family protein [Acidobacteriota bacterium]